MKKKIWAICLFVLFALPIPVALLGARMTFLWFLSSVLGDAFLIESITAFCGMCIGAAYLFVYNFSILATRAERKLTWKTLLPLAHCVLALLYLLALNPIGEYVDNATEYFGFAKKDFAVVDQLDTHGGFMGDGAYYLILDCSENRAAALEKIKAWKPLPMSESLQLLMYGGEKDGIIYGYNMAERGNIPKVENGYYWFEDRHSESKNSEDDSEIFDRHSMNFSIAVYDCDADRLYYFEFDS